MINKLIIKENKTSFLQKYKTKELIDLVTKIGNKKINLIDESYNANPLSVRNAIERFNTIQKDKFKKYDIIWNSVPRTIKGRMLKWILGERLFSYDDYAEFIKRSKNKLRKKFVPIILHYLYRPGGRMYLKIKKEFNKKNIKNK